MSKPPAFVGTPPPNVGETARDAATDVASTARDVARERVNATKDRAVSGLDSVAGALRSGGDSLEDNELVQDYIERAADGVEQITNYFKTRSPSQMVSDVERFARREPALFLGGALALGVLGARFLKSSSHRESRFGGPQRNVDPLPQQSLGVSDPNKPRGGTGSGAL